MDIVLLSIYGLFLAFIFMYSLIQLNLAILYLRAQKKAKTEERLLSDPEEWPIITVQLPVFNELYVVERLLESVAALDYPRDKLEIQLLDDSTDESVQVAKNKVDELKSQGLDISHVRRKVRVGYKAGALAYGLEVAKGEFTAIFDADFVPKPEFLKRTIPYLLADEKIGVVQTRWEHLNEKYSLLTRLQAFGLDGHFRVEQLGRNVGGHFINFNGTAGVWRNKCIEDAGGWQHDTITEDLDLSYRAQLKGWEFKYLHEVESPAELPVEMNGLKSQQYRWTKGAAECAVKNLPSVMKSRSVPFSTKIHGVFHLMSGFIFVSVFFSALLSVPILYVKSQSEEYELLFKISSGLLLSFVILFFFFWTSRPKRNKNFFQFLFEFPAFLSVSMGMSLHNAIAVLEGYAGRKTPFVRTPKYGIVKDGTYRNKKYKAFVSSPLTILESTLVLYFLAGVVLAFYLDDYGLLPFHIMLTLGFSYVVYYSVKHARA